jgi:5-methylcytosine-specific restriction endonuclease McrA
LGEGVMARTLRSKKLRAALWRMTGGKCSACGAELTSTWHADHIVPWVKRQITNVHEMQPLCATCNLKKGAS